MRWQYLSGWAASTLAGLFLVACAEQALPGRSEWTEAQNDANWRCQGGSLPACSELGRSLLARDHRASGTTIEAQDRNRALVLLEAACSQDDAAACTALGAEYARMFQRAERGMERAGELLKPACDRRIAAACTALGTAALAGTPGVGTAVDRFHAGCDLGDAPGCEDYGLALLLNPLGDAATVEAAFARACALGLASSCQRLATLWLQDPARRAAGLRQLADACNRGQLSSCVQSALASAPLLAGHPDCKWSSPFAAKACQGNDPDGCAVEAACRLDDAAAYSEALGRLRVACEARQPLACLYWADAEAPAEATRERVKRAYEVACRRSSPAQPIACVRLVILALSTTTLSFEAEKLIDQLRRACSESLGDACCALAGEYKAGKWLAVDAGKASELRARACELGQDRCCQHDTN